MYHNPLAIFNNGGISSVAMVLDQKKVPKDVYDWLMDEALEFHEGNEEIMKKVKRTDIKTDAT